MTPRHLLVLASLAVLLAADPSLGHGTQEGHAHLAVALGDDSTTATGEPDGQLTFRFEGTLLVETNDEGAFYIRLALPDGATVNTFTAPGIEPDTEMRVVDTAEARYVARFWTEDPPANGTPIPDVTMVAVQEVDPRASFVVRWPGVGLFEDLPVRVEIPDDLVLTSGRDLAPVTHGPPGRSVYQDFDFDNPTLDFSIRPSYAGPDPAFSAPPSPLTGWLIIVGIALVSAAAWAGGKKLENRGKA